MDTDGFWDLIERSATLAAAPDARLEWLTDRLAELPPEEIEDFQMRLDEARDQTDSWTTWGAGYLICDSLCSDDGYWYFLAWLVGLGRETHARIAADPDALADVPAVLALAGRSMDDWGDDEWPEWESLDYVADTAYTRKTGEEEALEEALERRGHETRSDADPQDDRWEFEDPAEAARRLPRIAALFPLSPRAERDARGEAAFQEMLSERGETEDEFLAGLGIQRDG